MPTHPTPSDRSAVATAPRAAGRSVYMASFGCQMNLLDSELVLGDLARRGYGRVDEMSDADVILVNTCSIRDHAEAKVWSLLGRTRQMKEAKPDLLVGVMGCMAQRTKDEIVRRAPHVDLILGTSDFRTAVTDLEDLRAGGGRVVRTARRPTTEFLPDADRNVTVRPKAHKAYVTIMRGCNHACTYCIVPHTRGPEYSRPMPQVLDEVRRLVADGVREITFLGQNINTYHQDLNPGREHTGEICTLLERASAVDGLDRIRFLTSNPFDMTERMMQRFGAVPKLMPWLHIPAQSGSDRVLRAMQRTYSAHQYREVVGWARRHIAGVEITSDFIVGFPGETEEDFQATLRLVEEMGFVQCYVFKYSMRPRTLAARRLPDDVPEPVKQRRNVELLALQDTIAERRNGAMIGKRVEVLIDGVSRTREDMLSGREPGNRLVHFPGAPALAGRMGLVDVEEAGLHSLVGRLASVE
ncbi:MAG: tRNA (N6-isopentenyl adenosine(37)-C2)-methylthiotransferase MiaB [Planctomycetota bacterium]|jgi:tRNA-2-methylthio-N6-dimethylallyladenosine synthase